MNLVVLYSENYCQKIYNIFLNYVVKNALPGKHVAAIKFLPALADVKAVLNLRGKMVDRNLNSLVESPRDAVRRFPRSGLNIA